MSSYKRSSLAWCLVGLAGLGCGAAENESPPSDEPVEVIGTGQWATTVCRREVVGSKNGVPIVESESYRFGILNERLAKYPELVSVTGLSEVGTCSEARQFTRLFREQLESHPELADVSIPDSYWADLDNTPPPEAPLEDEAEVPKIFKGEVGNNEPVVQIEFDARKNKNDPPEIAICSGTFISGRWLLTAAHCIPDRLWHNVPDKLRDLPANFESEITWRDGAGDTRSRKFRGTAFRYPGYGTIADTHADVALVYLYAKPSTPLRSAGLLEPEVGALPVLDGDIPAQHPLEQWGWGTTTGQPGKEDSGAGKLRTTGPVYSLPAPENREWFSIKVTAATDEPRGCRGDSGGPLLLTNQGDQPFIAAVFSSDIAQNRLDFCGNAPVHQNFCRLSDAKLDWINELVTLRTWGEGGFYECREHVKPLNPAIPDKAIECWAKECDITHTCDDSGYTCYAPNFESPERCYLKKY